jgi:hypothetical protein
MGTDRQDLLTTDLPASEPYRFGFAKIRRHLFFQLKSYQQMYCTLKIVSYTAPRCCVGAQWVTPDDGSVWLKKLPIML